MREFLQAEQRQSGKDRADGLVELHGGKRRPWTFQHLDIKKPAEEHMVANHDRHNRFPFRQATEDADGVDGGGLDDDLWLDSARRRVQRMPTPSGGMETVAESMDVLR